MCGIAGVYQLNGRKVPIEVVESIETVIKQRCPGNFSFLCRQIDGRIKEGFFKNGWVRENLSLSGSAQKFMIETQNPYFIAQLASVEIFGRIYDAG
jgi:hypothetical protein